MADLDEAKRGRFQKELLAWADENLRDYPWRKEDASLYEVFLAEFFLTQTPAKNVATFFPDFIERFQSLESIDRASIEELTEEIEPLGFQNIRARALKEIAAEHDTLPETAEELQSLTRVGLYVANTTLCLALGKRLPILDRNVHRVYRRVFDSQYPESETVRREFAETLLPEDAEDARTYNMALLDFGALLCNKIEPSCSTCFASTYCDYLDSTTDIFI